MKVILDNKFGKFGCKNNDTITKVNLTGEKLFEGSNFFDHLYLSMEGDELNALYLPYSGYSFYLFIGDFTGDSYDDILVMGDFGGSGGYKIVAVYTCRDGKLVQIFNHNMFEENIITTAHYVDDYIVILHNNNLNMDYFLPLDYKNNTELDMVYDENKKYKGKASPTVSGVNYAFPVKNNNNTYYNLLMGQRVIGQINADTLGVIETIVDISNPNIKAVNQNVYTYALKTPSIIS